jgi:hypothetical protein
MNPVTEIISLVTAVVSRIWPDATQSKKDLMTLEITREINQNQTLQKYLDADNRQTDVNVEQAKSDNLFVSGPRPYIMWGLGTILIIYSFLTTGIGFAVALGYNVVPMPPMDPMMRDIILGLLGLGYITRSYEKSRK